MTRIVFLKSNNQKSPTSTGTRDSRKGSKSWSSLAPLRLSAAGSNSSLMLRATARISCMKQKPRQFFLLQNISHLNDWSRVNNLGGEIDKEFLAVDQRDSALGRRQDCGLMIIELIWLLPHWILNLVQVLNFCHCKLGISLHLYKSYF